MRPASLEALRECMEGAVPATIATSSAAGEPNVAYLSQVEFVGPRTLALSFQFFNQTRRNVLANPSARLVITHPATGARYRLLIRYQSTQTSGPLFERMKAKLAGIASHTGMAGIFRLQGSDLYAVEEIERIAGEVLPAHAPGRSLLGATRATIQRLGSHREPGAAIECVLACLAEEFELNHACILLLDPARGGLVTAASMGYPHPGVGSEVAIGEGVVGVAARERTPIRIGHATTEYAYGRAVRESAERGGLEPEASIPPPGLPDARSQIAVPIEAFGEMIGVLFADSREDLRFGWEEEDALVTVAAHLGAAIRLLRQEPPGR